MGIAADKEAEYRSGVAATEARKPTQSDDAFKLTELTKIVRGAMDGDSNDDEFEAWRNLAEEALHQLGRYDLLEAL
jgi:hypothetical protein